MEPLSDLPDMFLVPDYAQCFKYEMTLKHTMRYNYYVLTLDVKTALYDYLRMLLMSNDDLRY